MPLFETYGAWINIDKNHMIEYDRKYDREPERRTVSCYVACETGKRFKVEWRVPEGDGTYLISLFIDGQPVDSCVSYACGRQRTDEFDGIWVDHGKTQKSSFVFSVPQFKPRDPSDDIVGDGVADGAEIGAIYLEMVEVQLSDSDSESEAESGDEAEELLETLRKSLPEEKSSMVTHTVSTIREEVIGVKPPDTRRVREFPDSDAKPKTRFTFRYRSEDFLRASGILPSLRRSLRKSDSTARLSSERLQPDPASPALNDDGGPEEIKPALIKEELEGKGSVPPLASGLGVATSIGDDGAEVLDIPNAVLSLTAREILERKDRIAQEKDRIAQEKVALEREERILEAQEERMRRGTLADDKTQVVGEVATKKRAKTSVEIIDLTED